MKKIFAVAAALVIIFTNAFACGTPVLPNETATWGIFSDCSYWVIYNEYHEVIGITSPNETAPIYPIQTTDSCVVRGFSSTGLIRVKGRARITKSNETYIGLTCLNNVTVKINPVYQEIVTEVVNRRTGSEVSASTIIASTIWYTDDMVSHIFYKEQLIFNVGTVYFNSGKDFTHIYCGDFDGDGFYELGFVAGENDYKPTPEPVVTPTPTRRPPVNPEPTPPVNPEPTPRPKECDCKDNVFKFCVSFCVTITRNFLRNVNCGCR